MFKRLFSKGDDDEKKKKEEEKAKHKASAKKKEHHSSERRKDSHSHSSSERRKNSHSGESERRRKDSHGDSEKKKEHSSGGAASKPKPKSRETTSGASSKRRRRKDKGSKSVMVDTTKPLEWPTTPEQIIEYHRQKPFLTNNEEWLIVELNEFECLVDSHEIIKIIAKHSKFFDVEPPELLDEFFEYVEEMPSYDEIINYDVWQEFRDEKYAI